MGLEFHQRVRKAYLELAQSNPDRFIVIDASRNEKAIHDDIIAQLEPLLKAAQAS
jgi:dTMP kinase